jgi:hypothetical protein
MVMENVPIPDAARKLQEWFGSKRTVVDDKPNVTKVVTIAKTEIPEQPAILPVPDSFVKQMPFMQQIEQWFRELTKLRDNEDDGQYHKRVLAGVKLKVLESYRAGKTATTT